MHPLTIRERRRRSSRWFTLRVCLLLALIGGVAYSAWLAPWAKNPPPIRVETVR